MSESRRAASGDGPVLDHMVVNVRLEMDEAARQFASVGLTLTPRGYHSLGSINHLMMFGTDYLELIGLPSGADHKRPDIARAPVGINGLVFKSYDVDATYAHLATLGIDGDPPHSFTRPVETDGTSKDASFSTVTVRAGVFEAGRVYFCQHHTPELVWRPQWQTHANGIVSTREFVIVAREPEAEAERYGALLELPVEGSNDTFALDLNGAGLRILSTERYEERFGELASGLGDAGSLFGAISLTSTSLDAAKQCVIEAGEHCRSQVEAERLVIRLDAFSTVLEITA